MMSGSRQTITGRAIKNFLIWGLGLALLWWLPVLVVKYWPELSLISKEPWLLEVSDLTWKRALVNLATKPGFRAVWVLGWSAAWIVGWLWPTPVKKQKYLVTWKKRLSKVSFRSSMEWAMDGKRASAIKEYARLVGVI